MAHCPPLQGGRVDNQPVSHDLPQDLCRYVARVSHLERNLMYLAQACEKHCLNIQKEFKPGAIFQISKEL